MEGFKFLLILLGYALAAPAVANLLVFRTGLRRPALALMLLLTALPPGWFTLTAWSQDWYRGHARGYQGSVVEILALGILLAAAVRRRPAVRAAAMVAAVWLAYCAICGVSLFWPYDDAFARMAAFKYAKLALLPAAAYVAVEDERDVRALLGALAAGLVLNLGAAALQRYGQGLYRVHGLFEHSNSLAMWAYSSGAVLLAASTTRAIATRDVVVWIGGALSGGALAIMSLARASIAACAATFSAIVLAGLCLRPNLRGAVLTVGMLLAMAAMLGKSMDSIRERVAITSAEAGYEDFRPVLERQAWAMSGDHPFGVGWNNYCIANSRPAGEPYSEILEDWEADRGSRVREEVYLRNPMVENIYLLHLAEVGWLGLIAYLAILVPPPVAMLWAAIRHRKGLIGGACAGLLVATLVVYAHGTIERVMVETKNLSAWLILVGFALRAVRLEPGAVAAPPSALEPDAPMTERGRVIPWR